MNATPSALAHGVCVLPHRGAGTAELFSLQGTIQRVDYQQKELRVVGQGQVWRFGIARDCQLWFNGTPTILRCFHALDPVTVIFDARNEVRALYLWEPQPIRAA